MVVEDKSQSMSNNRKIFTCAEIEEKNRNTKSSCVASETSHVVLMDPAVINFSSKSNVTRYSNLDLMLLKHSKASQLPPKCLNEPSVARLTIFKLEQPNQEENEAQKALRYLLPNLTINNCDPKVYENINAYHKSLMNNQRIYLGKETSNARSPQMVIQSTDRTGFYDGQNQFYGNQYNQQPTYNRKNFFDDITSHCRPPRMGIGSLTNQKNRRPMNNSQQFRNAKGNTCTNERYAFYPNNLSSGSISLNETKSSYDESINKSHEKADKESDKMNNESKGSSGKVNMTDDTETEPEWFTWPASRHDVIDLHGFEDEEASIPVESVGRTSSRNENKVAFDEFIRNNQSIDKESVASSAYRRSSYNQQNRQNRSNDNGNYYTGYNWPQYRNLSKSSASSNGSFNRSDNYTGSANINPFFEMWKRKNVPHENVDFLNWMKPNSNPNIVPISDVEKALIRNENQSANQYQKQQLSYPFGNSTIPQFFANASNSSQISDIRNFQGPITASQAHNFSRQEFYPISNLQPRNMPTQEQLQQHTSEIMRNAVMRKKFQEEKKFPK